MALDLEEQEQFDAFKSWWKANGRIVSIAVTVLILGLVGYKSWDYYQHEQSSQASIKYDALTMIDPKDTKAIQTASGELIENYASTPYAGRAALTVAKANYDANDIKSAKSQLQWAAQHAKEVQVQALANLQLAAILLEEKSYDEALKTLSEKHDEGFDGLFADLKGDVLIAQGKKDEAKAAYQEALSKLDAEGRYYRYTEHKLEALGS
ncbi:MAG: tetratricopeptide repeat protein [Methylophilaceae bacterium]